jgi:hypothetical protein
MRAVALFLLVSLGIMMVLYGISDPFDPPIGPRNPRPGAERYLRTRGEVSPEERTALMAFRPLPPDLLRRLASAPSREVRAYVAASPSADSSILRSLLHDSEPAVRGYLATNPRTPHALLVELGNDPDENVRWGLPGNPNWTGEEIRQMYRQGASRTVIARNASSPPDLLEELARSDDYGVRSALVGNPSISESIAMRLAQDPRDDIRLRLTYNSATPFAVLTTLAADRDGKVRRYAAEQLRKRRP